MQGADRRTVRDTLTKQCADFSHERLRHSTRPSIS